MSVNIYENGELEKVAGSVHTDAALNKNSTNPIQNKVVTEKFEELNSDKVNKGDIVVLTTTTGNESSANIVTMSYPSGFNVNNCVIISCMYKITMWSQHRPEIYGQLRDNAVSVYYDGSQSQYRNIPVKVTLMKIA